jgi:cytochrome bd-type quinol oxidase subunit 2
MSSKLVSVQDVISIIQTGIAGVAFLFLFMSFYLLLKEQKRPGSARDNILKEIRKFTILSLLFTVLVGIVSFIEKGKSNRETEACRDAIERGNLLIGSKQQTVESMRELFGTIVEKCK